MAITPLFMTGGGFFRGGIYGTEFDNTPATQPRADGGIIHTGAYSLRPSYGGCRGVKNVPATRQFRAGLWMYSNGAALVKSVLLEWKTALGAAHISWVGAGSADQTKLAAYVGNHAAAAAETSADAFAQDQWYNIGIDVKVDNANGWIYVWQDGVNIIHFDGNTGNADIEQIILAECGTGAAWNFLRVADYYFDDTTGEAAPSIPPDRRIYCFYPKNAARTYAEGLAKGGGASSYTQVDEGAVSDLDTTYNYVDALDERETYAINTAALPALPASGTIYAVQVKAHALKTDAGVDTQIAIMTRGGAAPADNEDAAQALAGDWLLYSGDIETLDPAGQPWTLAQIQSLEIGVRGKGTF